MCGCDQLDTDTDGDGQPDCIDPCMYDSSVYSQVNPTVDAAVAIEDTYDSMTPLPAGAVTDLSEGWRVHGWISEGSTDNTIDQLGDPTEAELPIGIISTDPDLNDYSSRVNTVGTGFRSDAYKGMQYHFIQPTGVGVGFTSNAHRNGHSKESEPVHATCNDVCQEAYFISGSKTCPEFAVRAKKDKVVKVRISFETEISKVIVQGDFDKLRNFVFKDDGGAMFKQNRWLSPPRRCREVSDGHCASFSIFE